MTKTSAGNFFEDFRLGQTIRHATPRTLTEGDAALYFGLFGARFAVQSSAAFATAIGYPARPIDDLLVFHVIFGKTVPDISLNAVANLGYAGGQFLAPVFAGDTLSATSEVIGLKENSSRQTGIVYVRTRGIRQDGTPVLEYVRWVMVRKRDERAPAPGDHVPRLPTAVEPSLLGAACPPIDVEAYDLALAGSRDRFDDYAAGEKIDHVDGVTVEEAEHQTATRLYQNTARIHFDQFCLARPLRPPPDLWRTRDLARARDLIQRSRQCLPHRRDQWRPPRRALVCRPSTVFAWSESLAKVNCRAAATSARSSSAPSPPADRPCARFSSQERRGIRPGRSADLDYGRCPGEHGAMCCPAHPPTVAGVAR